MNISQSNKTDSMKEALGIEKGEEMSIEEAVRGANPYYAKDNSYQMNCQRCVQAYEMRRRGYDVIAKPMPSGFNDIEWGSECFEHPGQSDEDGGAYTLNKTAWAVRKELASAPNGARYSIYVDWKAKGESAHVFIAEKQKGKVRYVDPQTGEKASLLYFFNGKPNGFGYFRMDDKAITSDISIIKSTVEVKKR